MRGDARTVKDRLDIAELVSGYIKLEKAGASFKGRCPFHNEKTPSFFVSPARQSYYCFGCGAKGDVFTFVEEMEGIDFLEALNVLAEKAGVELEKRSDVEKGESEKIFSALEEATKFFEKTLVDTQEAKTYVEGRGIDAENVKAWRIGYAPAEWRALYSHLLTLGFGKEVIIKAGLAKVSDEGREPYDIFRDRIIFPLFDRSGRVIAFSGRALGKETEPKYLNSPDTPVFTKSEVLYGLDRAKDQIRKRNFAVLVEGQMDLVHSHQAGVGNTVASSGTAFTAGHLEKLKGLSTRIILAFDGDPAGVKAAEKAALLGISMGFEVKIAPLPEGKDPADVAHAAPEEWKNILRAALPAVEFFFNKAEEKESDKRKLGRDIETRILPMIKLIGSSIERSHFISLLARRTGLKEEILWEDLKRAKAPDLNFTPGKVEEAQKEVEKTVLRSWREQVEERLAEIGLWLKELPDSAVERVVLQKEESELKENLEGIVLRGNLSLLSLELARAEAAGEEDRVGEITKKISGVHVELRSLEEKKKAL